MRAWLGERAWPRRVRASRLNSGAMHDGIQPRRSVASRKLGEPHTGKSATRSEPGGPGRKHVEGQRTSSSGRQRPGRRRPQAPLTSTSKESTPPKCLSSTALPSMTGLLAMAPTGRTQGAAGRTCEGERRARPPEGSREEAMTSPLLLLPFKERFLRSRHVSRALLPLSFQKRHRKVQKAAVAAAHAALHRQRETRSARGQTAARTTRDWAAMGRRLPDDCLIALLGLSLRPWRIHTHHRRGRGRQCRWRRRRQGSTCCGSAGGRGRGSATVRNAKGHKRKRNPANVLLRLSAALPSAPAHLV